MQRQFSGEFEFVTGQRQLGKHQQLHAVAAGQRDEVAVAREVGSDIAGHGNGLRGGDYELRHGVNIVRVGGWWMVDGGWWMVDGGCGWWMVPGNCPVNRGQP